MFEQIVSYSNLLDSIKEEYGFIYIILLIVINIASLKTIVPFLIDFFNPYVENKNLDLLKLFAFIIILAILVMDNITIFLFSIGLSIAIYFKAISKYFTTLNPLASEKHKYIERHHKIDKKGHYDFINILFLYNLISLTDYERLYEKHYHKSEEEKLDLLKETFILDKEKEMLAKYLYSKYKETGELVELDEEVFEKIQEDIKKI